MTKYSRVSKYEDLRNKLQNDTDTKIESKDLSRYKKKLNEINSSNFEAPKETYSEENPNGRWRKFTIEDILARDKTSLDITWMKADSGTDDYTLTELLDMIKEKSSNIAKAVAELEALIGEVEE